MSTQGRLIALCSPAMGSGKSTVAEYLANAFGFQRIAFAGPLKEMACAMLRSLKLPDDEIVDRVYGTIDAKERVIPSIGVSSRRIMQTLGTEWGRDCIGQSIWTDIAMGAAARLRADGLDVVIDDMRFPNEHAAVTATGGTSIRVLRPGTIVTSAHPSEGQLNDAPMVELRNDGSVLDLYDRIDEILLSTYR